MAQRWFVAVSDDELACVVAMRFVGITAFVPMERRAWQHPRTKRWKLLARPMMPGYVFCLLDRDEIGLALDLRHVSHLLPRKGEEPLAVLDSEEGDVEAFREAEEANSRLTVGEVLGWGKKRQERALMAPGTVLRVTEGAFQGMEAKVEGDDGAERLRVIIGRLKVTIPATQVEAA